MTTIAFDGKTLAVDRASWKGNFVWTPVTKLFHIRPPSLYAVSRFNITDCTHMVYAAAGNASEVPLVVAWLHKGGELPVFKPDGDDTSRGLLLDVTNRRIYALTSILTLEPYESNIVADGGGYQMVLGAMLAGATAVEAIELTSTRSGWAAGGVDSYTLPDLEKG